MKVKEESEKVGLKLNIQKTKIMASGPVTSWQIDGGKVEIVIYFTILFSWATILMDVIIPVFGVGGGNKLELLLCVTGLGDVMVGMGMIPEQRFGF